MKKKFDDDVMKWLREEIDKLTKKISVLVDEHFPGQSIELSGVDIESVPFELYTLSSVMELVSKMRELINAKNTKIPVTLLLEMFVGFSNVVASSNIRLLDAKARSQRLSNSRHAENREIAERIKAWYIETHNQFRSMDAAAEAAAKIEPVAVRTARKHIVEAAKNLPSARK